MKRKLLCAAIIVILISLWAYGTLAYFTVDDETRNVITSGEIHIELLETDAEGHPFTDPMNVVPGISASKVVRVKNTSNSPCFVRIKVEKTIAGGPASPDLSLILLDYNNADWVQAGDVFYYKRALNAGEETVPLFRNMVFDIHMGNAYMNATAKIDVRAQAVQSENNGGGDPLAAAGWPAF